jgi:uncharacterized protein
MSARTPRTVIDGLEFARTEQELRGQLPLAQMTRLQDGLYDAGGTVDFVLIGGCDHQKQRPILRLEIFGSLQLLCQRCLGRLDYPLQIVNSLWLLRQDEAAPKEADEPEALDCLVAQAAMDVATLIEDEILLSLPQSPRHPDGACSAMGGAAQSRVEASPFARLAALKK